MELIFPRVVTEDRPPTNFDDSSRGYVVGQPWVDTSTSPPKYYICKVVTVDNALWEECITPSTLGDVQSSLSEINNSIMTFKSANHVDLLDLKGTLETQIIAVRNDLVVLRSTLESINNGILGILSAQTSSSIQSNFSSNILSGYYPLTVNFSDMSIGNANTYLWNFGDGQTSTLKNPTHIYTTEGSYTVSLKAYNGTLEDTNIKNNYILVTAPLNIPVAQFQANVTTVTPSTVVTFTNMSTGEINSYLWDFGDGQTSTATNPTHTYTTIGNFTVRLTAIGNNKTDTEEKVGYITVQQVAAPVAQFSATPITGLPPLTVTFTNTSSGQVNSYNWDFGDSNVSTLINPVHTYTSGGIYSVALTVTGNGGSDVETKTNYITIQQTTDPYIETTSLTCGEIIINDWSTRSFTAPHSSWALQSDYDDTALKATHNLNKYPVMWTGSNIQTNIEMFITETTSRYVENESLNSSTFRQCSVADQFKLRLFFEGTGNGCLAMRKYKIQVSNWNTTPVINGPAGWVLSKNGIYLQIVHNMNKNPKYLQSDSFDLNSIRNLYMTSTNQCMLNTWGITSSNFILYLYFLS